MDSTRIRLQMPKGTYIVAVSGGVDSMVLLDVLRRMPGLNFIVAHVNHGIRADASRDRELIEQFAMSHNLKTVFTDLKLGPDASEATARKQRYNFLQNCRKRFNADAILTAHHQDDLIETAIINILRGTGWRGLAPFLERTDVLRPLLDYAKTTLLAYAKHHNIPWREDTTNTNQAYLRNYVRRTLIPLCNKRNNEWQQVFLQLIRKQQQLRRTIQKELDMLASSAVKIQNKSLIIERYIFIMLPPTVSYQLLQHTYAKITDHTLEQPLAQSLLLFIKVAKNNKRMPLGSTWQARATVRQIIVDSPLPVVS